MESKIKWQTGEPKENGAYLVTTSGRYSDYVTYDSFQLLLGWTHYKQEEIIAWCKLSDIEPYKED